MKIYNQNGELIVNEDLGININNVLANISKPAWCDASLNKLRTITTLDSGAVIATVSAVTVISDLTNLNAWQAHIPVISTNLSSWAAACRSRIT